MTCLIGRSINGFCNHVTIHGYFDRTFLIDRFTIFQVSSNDSIINKFYKDLIRTNSEILGICNIFRRRVIHKNTSSDDKPYDISRHIHISQDFCTDRINKEVFKLLQYKERLRRFIDICHDIVPHLFTISLFQCIIGKIILIETVHDQRCM